MEAKSFQEVIDHVKQGKLSLKPKQALNYFIECLSFGLCTILKKP